MKMLIKLNENAYNYSSLVVSEKFVSWSFWSSTGELRDAILGCEVVFQF